ncbi:unnamed protein product [marine sediment metagenome]|uniref:Uncharacterized protein n=1 Tax=marine sediment metagenome TaxID=412755 RepID=X1ETH3_9ZZZZ
MSMIVQATPAISAGKSFVAPLYRQFDVMNAADVTPFVVTNEYEAVFGSIGPATMQIFVKMFAINWATGQAGIPLAASCIISA